MIGVAVDVTPASLPVPPAQPAKRVSLGDMRACFEALDQARRLFALSGRDWAAAAHLSHNSLCAWKESGRDPRLSRFIDLAAVVGFAVVLRGPDGAETNLRDLPGAIERINAARCAQAVSFAEMEARAGVSISSFFAWRRNRRDPTVANLIAIAQTFGFEVEMRRSW